MPGGMHTYVPLGAHHESTGPLYAWALPRGNRNGRNGFDLCEPLSSAPPAQTRPALGRSLRGHAASWAARRQKHRWPPWLAVGCGIVRALGGVDVGAEPQRARAGSVPSCKGRGAGVPWAPGRAPVSEAGPCPPRPGVCRPGQGGCGREPRVDPAGGQGLWLCRSRSPLVRYHGPGVAHGLSQRTGAPARVGAALWPRPGAAQTKRSIRRRPGAGAGRDHPPVGQRTPPVCPGRG
jgi:hypothetical protein